ncbi:MAG TPA: alpha/beta hydrolase, partial [Rubrivivax sp.]
MAPTSAPDPLLLVPGLMCDHAVWAPLMPALAEGRACTVVDHGSANSLVTMAHQLLATAPPRFALAGHSMGGRVALEVVRLEPGRVSRLALLDTGYLPRPAGAAGDEEARKRV